MTLPTLTIEPDTTATASVIWLHGLGADGNDFAPIVPELQLPATHGIRFIFPHAPAIPVTVNNNAVMPAWYDIREMTIDSHIDTNGILKPAVDISTLIDVEIQKGIESERIVIAGFSQGGAVAYQCALTYPRPLAGLLALSTYFATRDVIIPSEYNHQIPILICHGSHDPVIPESLGRRAYTQLLKMGYPVEFKSYPMAHNICNTEITGIGQWLSNLLLEPAA